MERGLNNYYSTITQGIFPMSSLFSSRRFRWNPAGLLTLYVVLHPFIDILTFLGVQAKMFLTVGNAVRTLFLIAALLYILCCESFPGRGPLLLFLGAVTAYLGAFCVLNFLTGGFWFCAQNLMEAVKVFYFPYMAAFLYTLYKKEGFVAPDWAVACTGAGYCAVILIAFLTNTSYISYNAGYGYCGWFFSANDVSTAILITAPLLIYGCLVRIAREKRAWVFLLVGFVLVSLIFSAAFIGTKLLFLGVLLYFLCAFVWLLARFFRRRDKGLLRCALAVVVLCAALVGLYPVSPLNSYMQDIYIPMSGEDPEALRASQEIPGIIEVDRKKAIEEYEEAARGTWLGDKMEESPLLRKVDWILSKRLTMMAPVVQEYGEEGLPCKLLGLGYVSRDPGRDISHMIEMEGPAMLLRHGVLGFALYYVPFLGVSLYLLFKFFRHFARNLKDLRYCSLFYAVAVAFAASMVVGHVLAPPCTSLLAALLYEKLLLRTQEESPDLFQSAEKRATRTAQQRT